MVKIAHIDAAGIVVNITLGTTVPEPGALDAFGHALAVCMTGRIGDQYLDGQYLTPPPPLPTEADVDELAKAKRDAIVDGVSAAEMASWPIKRAEALAYAASGLEADAPLLSIEADARGVPLADLVARVQANAATLGTLEAQIAGTAGRHRDALATLLPAEVAGYDISAGWPV